MLEHSEMSEAWVTDFDLKLAQEHYASKIPDFVLPMAYSVARIDPTGLVFGHVNKIGEVRPLPAVVLAFVTGYSSTTSTFKMTRQQFHEAITLLTPAESARHMGHPNLWSWREIYNTGNPTSAFLAFFVADIQDAPISDEDSTFRQLIRP